jgi:hypothetical protein
MKVRAHACNLGLGFALFLKNISSKGLHAAVRTWIPIFSAISLSSTAASGERLPPGARASACDLYMSSAIAECTCTPPHTPFSRKEETI